jgi:putative transferase (TIGR04331 family)
LKINFVVSVFNKVWVEGSRKLFAIDAYIHHFLEKGGSLDNYEEVEVLPSPRSTREELIADHNIVDQKYQKYVVILADRLNKIHGTDYDLFFWQKSLSLSLIRNITFMYDIFQRCEGIFDPEIHDCKILSEASYYTPFDFNDHRNFFQSTAFGQEQMFSIYINKFYPGKFEVIKDHFIWPLVPTSKSANKFAFYFGKISRITLSKLIIKLINYLKKIRKPRIAVLDSYFSPKNLLDLIIKSKGEIQQLPVEGQFVIAPNLDRNKRRVLSEENQYFDRFDNFFFSSLKHCFPKIFLEDFSNIYKYYQDYFSRYQQLEYVVNESWIGNNYSSIAVAILQQKGVKHICNEHNYLSHHFLCNNNKYLIPLTDKYLTLGWFKEGYQNLMKGGSLFEWVIDKEYKKEHDILYVNGPPAIKVPEMSAAYGHFGGFNATLHTEFIRSFLGSLKTETLKTCVFRGYPVNGYAISYLEPQMLMYDQDYLYEKYLKHFKLVDHMSSSAKVLIQKSRLIIIDYLSTSYLESMFADIPTIFFWNEVAYPLESEHQDFYAPLISVGICQTNPIQAAAFVEKIKGDPEKWWNHESVKEARKEFLSRNFGNKNILKDYILNLEPRGLGQ